MFHSSGKKDMLAQRLDQLKDWIALSEKKRREDGKIVAARLSRLDGKLSELRESEKKRQEDGTDVSARLGELDGKLSELRESEKKRQKDGTDVSDRLGELDGKLSELREAVDKHDLAIADMLDSWDEWRQNREETDNSLLEAVSGSARQEAAESQKRESALLSLAAACFDQLHTLRRSAREAGDETWLRQLEIAEEKLSATRLLAGVQIIDSTLCEVNYNLYEITAIVDTEDPDLARRIADVYSPGIVYRGSVLRKAVATAYRMKSH